MKLLIEDEAGTKSTVPFADTEVTVGRGAEGITFRLADRNVSRRHARFVLASGAVFVEDLGSLTGTRVNGEPIVGRRRLRPGDLVQIGDYDLVVAGQANGDEKEPPPLRGGQAARERTPVPERAGDRALVRRLAAVAIGALLAGAAAGWAVGRLTSPPPGGTASAVSR